MIEISRQWRHLNCQLSIVHCQLFSGVNTAKQQFTLPSKSGYRDLDGALDGGTISQHFNVEQRFAPMITKINARSTQKGAAGNCLTTWFLMIRLFYGRKSS